MALNRDRELALFIGQRLAALRAETGTSATRLAEIAGYERAAFHRMLRGDSVCNAEPLFRLSQHFSLPVGYFFPTITPADHIPVDMSQGNLLEQAAPMVRRMIRKLNALSAREKWMVMQVLGEAESVRTLTEVCELLQSASVEKRSLIMTVLKQLLTEKAEADP